MGHDQDCRRVPGMQDTSRWMSYWSRCSIPNCSPKITTKPVQAKNEKILCKCQHAYYFLILGLNWLGGDLRAIIWDTASAPIRHPSIGILHSWNPSRVLIILSAQRRSPCISLIGMDSSDCANIVFSAIFDDVVMRLVCTFPVVMSQDTR